MSIMKPNPYKYKSDARLESELKGVKIITLALLLVIGALFAVSLYGLVTKDDNSIFMPLIAVAICCSGILPVQFSSMKKIKEELQLRKSGEQ